ncbi:MULTISPECIES: hypothetical protein [unclassified Spirosoma]|uniref:hypothetical protein n=1 Tax=unclassified Spirosoma TaxID=2621999 RepID=UPI000960257F|nr:MULTISPECIES: hypothetical protein [unclassified Spirosoma]MBN8825860.1 hypothetical protein [Spirosoma sp.]OJW70555.1 MAG: hypothetical protein BGO59_25325 [Spirosoma sp. 48-14]
MRQFIITNFLLIVLVLAVAFAFIMKATIFQKEPDTKAKPAETAPTVFSNYWFANKAELNSYRLQQAKSGALHTGEATLIFQTENFLPAKQVKADQPAGGIPVLKTSLFKRFATGLYEYSLSTSVFTPVEKSGGRPVLFPNTLKVSMAGQEWDGHYYQQINYRDNAYQVIGKSFLEKEVDDAYPLDKVMLEDELWNQIRINPDKLPTGETRLIAGTMTARLRRKPIRVLPAKATLANYEGVLFPGNYLKSYTIEYPTDDRTLIIIFERDFPHKIVGWEETYDTKDNLLTSRAVLQKTVQTDYWNHKAPADSTLRKELLH